MSSAVIGALRVNLSINSAEFRSGLKDMQSGLQKVGKQVQSFGASFTKSISGPLLAAGAGVTAALTGMAGDVEALKNAATVANTDLASFQKLSFAAKSVGVESEKLSDIFKDVNDRVGEFSSTGSGEMKDFFTNIAPKVGITADAFKDLSGPQALQLYYNSLEKAGLSQQQVTFYMEALSDEATALVPLLKENGKGFRDLGQSATVLSEQDASSLIQYQQSIRGLGEALKSVLVAIVQSGFVDTLTSITNVVGGFVRDLAKTSPEIVKWGAIVATTLAVGGPVLVGLGLLATAVAAVGAPIALTVAGLSSLGLALVALYENWGAIQERFPILTGLFEKLGSVVAVTASGLGTQTGLIAQYLTQMVSGDIQGASATVGQIFTNLGDMFTELANVIIPGAGDTIRTKMKEIAAYIVDALKALPGQMLQIGADIISGLYNGISEKWESVKGKFREIVAYIPGIAREETDTHSPSRVMHAIGQDIMQGLQNGIVQGSAGVATATGDVVTDLNARLGQADATGAMDGLAQAGDTLAGKMADAFGSIIDGSKKLKDVIKDTLVDIGSSLLHSGLQGVFGNLFGGGSGFKTNTTLGALLGALPGFANGGSFQVGGAGGVDSQLVAFRASPNERVSITKPNQQRGGSSPTFVNHLDMRGSNWTEAQMNEKLEQLRRKITTDVRVNVTGWVQDDSERLY